MRLVCLIIVLLLFVPVISWADSPFLKYAVYYSDTEDIEAFEPYDLLVFDSQYHPPLDQLNEDGKTLLGYISLGEVEKHRRYYRDVRKEGILLQENKFWKGSYFVDVRSYKWKNRVIKDLIPAILAKGFDGIFLDTLDNPGELERIDPIEYSGMVRAAVLLVKEIRQHFPDITIMMNRGYELLPYVSSYIDMEMGESIYADYNFDTKSNELVDEKLYNYQVEKLKMAQIINEDLKIVTLDYWDISDSDGVAKIYEEQRKNGFSPYVATIDLDVLVAEPIR